MLKLLTSLLLAVAATAPSCCMAGVPKWMQPEQSIPTQFGNYETTPENYDWQLVLFFHLKKPDAEGKPIRLLKAYNHDTKEECEKGRALVLNMVPPLEVAPDGAVCVPLLKVSFPVDINKV